MRKLALLWPGLLWLSGGCSGGYPLEPTLCDDTCNVTEGALYCSDTYEPAQCVIQCEAAHLGEPYCRPLLDNLLDCFRTKPNAISEQCRYNPLGTFGCQLEQQALMVCIENKRDLFPDHDS